MTTHERLTCMFEHRCADRIPITDSYWQATIQRWHSEGMPENITPAEYFDLDLFGGLPYDISPRFENTVVEETDEYIIRTTDWGATRKDFKHTASTPDFIDYKIKTPDDWQQARQRMTISNDRVNWDVIKNHYSTWRERGAWIQCPLWFGFDLSHANIIGTERMLVALIEQPEWCVDIFNTCLDISITFADMIWDAGYTFDSVLWPDDMGYKYTQFFSLDMYRQLLKPAHQRAIEWAHQKGIRAHLHSCGDINPFVPELVDMGLDALNPLEVKAGMNPIYLKDTFGDRILLHGGINAVLWGDRPAIEAEMRQVIPHMKQNGGYMFSSDHSVPSSVSLEDFGHIITLAKQLGSYE